MLIYFALLGVENSYAEACTAKLNAMFEEFIVKNVFEGNKKKIYHAFVLSILYKITPLFR